MIETRVVEDPRVKAAVNSVHMRMLKAMLRPKKRARRRKFTYGLVGERERMVERDWDQEVVREVVVNLANTPLTAAHVPDATARMSHIGCRGIELCVAMSQERIEKVYCY